MEIDVVASRASCIAFLHESELPNEQSSGTSIFLFR